MSLIWEALLDVSSHLFIGRFQVYGSKGNTLGERLRFFDMRSSYMELGYEGVVRCIHVSAARLNSDGREFCHLQLPCACNLAYLQCQGYERFILSAEEYQAVSIHHF